MNVLACVHASRVRSKWRRAGSILLLLAPVFFLMAFAIEPAVGRVERPYALAGAVAALVGTSIHLVSSRPDRSPIPDPRPPISASSNTAPR
jgi:hypothetical protein